MTQARRRKRTAWAIATSILLHLALILPLAILIPRLPSPRLAGDEPMEVKLRRAGPALGPADTIARSSHMTPSFAAPPSPAATINRKQKAQDRPTVPSAMAAVRIGAGAAPDAQAGSAARATGETTARVRQALRRLGGCAPSALSSQDDLEACRYDRAQQYAIGQAMRMDAMPSAKRADYDHAREVCDRVYSYTGLDSDPNHSAKAPQVDGDPC
jgi:hypothetical protein